MNRNKTIPLPGFHELPQSEMLERSRMFLNMMSKRRTVREFSDQAVPQEIIKNCLKVAGSAPNGANRQPWHFVSIQDPEIKRKIRIAAEKEEREFYNHRAPQEWLEALEPLGTNEEKPYLEKAPYLIAIFAESYEVTADGHRIKNYYVKESVGIATGMLITAIHNSGLACLTHTPSPLGFLNKILGRPENEKPFLILVVGYPSKDAEVPDIQKKSLDKIVTFI